MKIEPLSHKVLSLAKAHGPSSRYLTIIDELAHSAPRPLRVVIDCERFHALSGPGKDPFALLLREIKLWSDVLGAKSLSSLNLIHPYRLLKPFEITSLLHMLATKFKVKEPDERRYVAVSYLEELTTPHLALIKGLNFNAYQMIVPKERLDDIDVIKAKTHLLRDFAIELVGIQLLHSDCLTTIRTQIRNIEAHCKPDYICLGKTWDTFDFVSMRAKQEEDNLLRDDNDLLELGPEAITRIGELHLQNYCSADKYKASIEAARLPIHTSPCHE